MNTAALLRTLRTRSAGYKSIDKALYVCIRAHICIKMIEEEKSTHYVFGEGGRAVASEEIGAAILRKMVVLTSRLRSFCSLRISEIRKIKN